MCVYFGLFALMTNLAVKRLRVPLMLAAPVAWVACEYLRAFVLTGFPWLFLAHTQYAFLPLIQISDITGAYGVSFVIVLVNAFIAEVVLRFIARKRYRKLDARGLLPRAICLAAVFALVLVYGFARLGAIRGKMKEGPRVLLIQPNVAQYLKRERESRRTLTGDIETLTDTALEKARKENREPDMIVWPETMIQPGPDCSPDCTAGWSRKVRERGCHFLAGGTYVRNEPHVYRYWNPRTNQWEEHEDDVTDWHNSAYFFTADGKLEGRYDKIHLVPFGEFVPLGNIFPFMDDVILQSAGFVRDLKGGEGITFFEMTDAGGNPYTFSTPICYEVGFPDLFASFVEEGGEKKADFIVNISNDGWFHESAELEQTTAMAAFRAVENRVGVIRATNTGISAFIRPDGFFSWENDVLKDEHGRMKSVQGFLLRRVYVCDDLSIYSRVKDVFAIVMLALSGAALLASFILRGSSKARNSRTHPR
ncbi:MAG: apolipoprotein N-acyltransferase [Planctomycetota bacterium]|nr:MAG: apolipoprotein N-acyltransferase [Planctomycetota bacterium]